MTYCFSVEVLGLALVIKMCPDSARALNTVSNRQAFSKGRNVLFVSYFFLGSPTPGTRRRMPLGFFAQKNRRAYVQF